MGFSVGDKVMHPNFGAGIITGESHRELVAGFEHYFVIQVMHTRATAYIPVRKMNELGVRWVMGSDKLAQVFETLRGRPRELVKDYKQRQARIEEQLDTRQPIPIAEAIRDLRWRKEEKHLTKRDADLLAKGVDLLASEMALATDAEKTDAQLTIDATIQAAMECAVDGVGGQAADLFAQARQDTFRRNILS